MINAHKELLNSFFSSNLQFVVPFFQRAYVWDEENWEILWDHLIKINDQTENTKSEHFIGTLITKQRPANAIRENKLDLIDGQQRLTTFSLLLKAIADTASGNEPFTKLKEKTNDLVAFEDSTGKKFIRIQHSRNDYEYYEKIILEKDLDHLPNQEHKILRCYRYFMTKLVGFDDSELDGLKNSILNNIPIISMLLAADDDEQAIFDTINSLGVRLTTGELLKNYIFSDTKLKDFYTELWEEVFEDGEDEVEFWNKSKTSGRTIRTNIEVLLYCYLIIQKRGIIELEKLFKEYKAWLIEKDSKQKKAMLEDLKEYAEIYFDLPEGTELNEISFNQDEERFFHIIEHLEITTIYPLVLYIYKNIDKPSERVLLLKKLESFLVRRNVCRLTTKNYNKLFIQILSQLDQAKTINLATLTNVLKSFTEDTNRYPSDKEFENAFGTEAISNSNAREVLFCISLYHLSTSKKNDVLKLSSSSFSTEHMMPQKWEKNWSKLKMSDAMKIERNKKIRTIGNLTLITKSLNSSMKNSAWDEKKKELKKYSSLKITVDYIDEKIWDEKKIDNRAKDLATAALKIWS